MEYEELSKLIKEAYRRGYNDRDKEESFDLGHALDLIYNPIERDKEEEERQRVLGLILEMMENGHICCYYDDQDAMIEVIKKEIARASKLVPPSATGS